MNQPVTESIHSDALPPDLLQSGWGAIQSSRLLIADEIEFRSEGLSGNFLNQANFARDFFRFDCTLEQAFCQPCILAIANPLAQFARTEGLSPCNISTAIYQGFCTLSRHGSNHRSLIRIFLTPLMMALFVIFGGIFLSHFVILPFEQMYAEFGIMLPRVTAAVLAFARFVRYSTSIVLPIVFAIPPLFWTLNRIGKSRREPGMSHFDLLLVRRRPTIARFLFHYTLLIESGLEKTTSIEKAAEATGKRWLWRRAKKIIGQDDKDSTNRRPFFSKSKFATADTALSMPRSRGQVAVAQQVATWYRDSSSGILEWWIQLMTPMCAAFILIGICVVVISLFMPLIAVISGLTGGPGGFF